MACFISAGHNPKGKKPDSGAVGNGKKEADLTVDFRNLVVALCKKRGLTVITDDDSESLKDYLKRIKTGAGSVVIEFHFDAATNSKATWTSCLIGDDADRLDKAFALELVTTTANTLGLKNRGVLSEKDSHRGRLGLMREQGTVALLELGFISNAEDLRAYEANKEVLAARIAEIIHKYELLVP